MDPNTQELLMGASGSSVPSDVDFENTVLLLHGDGTNGAQNNTFIDGSTNNFTITRNGNTTQGTFSPFGDRWSNYFDGNGDYLTAAQNSAFNFGTGSFTVEAWVYITGNNGLNSRIVGLGNGAVGGGTPVTTAWTLNINNNLSQLNWYRFDGTTETNLSASFSFNLNTWYHLVVVRNGSSNLSLYINGNRVYNNTSASTSYNNINSDPLYLAAVTDGSGGSASTKFFTGYISNVRVVSGTAVYDPTQTTLTTPTAPLTAVTNTSLLTCQSNRFVDNSTNNFTITPNGDVRVEKFNPFGRNAPYSSGTDGASGYFDGNGDYLSSPDSSALDLSGSTSWCIELWAYWNNLSGEQNLLEKFTGPTGPGWTLYKFAPSLGTIEIYGSTGSFNSGVTPTAGQWYHIVVCRDNSSSRTSFFINGIRTATTTTFSIGSNASTSFLVGVRNGGTTFFNGYLSNPRVVKGSSVYDPSLTSITIPAAPLTAIANTSLLLNFTNAGVIDNTGLNVLETVGNAQIDTGIKKFGTGSLEFDGSGDYLVTPSSSTFALSSNFTVEGWIYLNALNPLGNASYICDFRIGSINNFTLGVINSSGIGKLYLFVNGVDTTGSGTVSLSQWNHFAYVRIGSTITLYLNGTSSGTMTSSYVQGPTPVVIGARYTGSTEFVNGYIDDLRITNGIARYTANFTPPTAPFPDF